MQQLSQIACICNSKTITQTNNLFQDESADKRTVDIEWQMEKGGIEKCDGYPAATKMNEA